MKGKAIKYKTIDNFEKTTVFRRAMNILMNKDGEFPVKHNLINPSQHAHTKQGHDDHIYNVFYTDEITKCVPKGPQSIVPTEMSRNSFGKVPHQILLLKLKGNSIGMV